MKKTSAILISLAMLTDPTLFAGEVYRVVSEDGEVTFTDSPSTNAKVEAVNMSKINIAIAPPAKTKADDDVTEDEAAYTSVRIVQPSNNATIPPGQLEVVVQLALKPLLQSNHLVQLYIDGQKQGSAIAASTFTVSSLDRGKHRVHAEIIGTDKKHKAKTQTVTLHVKQHSSNN